MKYKVEFFRQYIEVGIYINCPCNEQLSNFTRLFMGMIKINTESSAVGMIVTYLDVNKWINYICDRLLVKMHMVHEKILKSKAAISKLSFRTCIITKLRFVFL